MSSPVRSEPRSAAPRSGATPVDTAWLDIARVAAMVAVVLLHAAAPVVTGGYTDFGTATWWTANAIDSMLRWCVPVFIMISGALLLKPRQEGLRSFYQRRFSRIGIPLVVWSAVYLSLELFYRGGLTWSDVPARLFSGSPELHLYFLFVLAGLYVLTPFLRLITRYASTRMLWWFAILMSGLGLVDEAIAAFQGIGEPNAVTRFLPFVGYYVMGYLLRETRLSARSTWIAGGVFVAVTAVTALGVGAFTLPAQSITAPAGYLYDYLSVNVVIMSVAAFLLLQSLGSRWRLFTDPDRDTESARRWLKTFSDLSFGVFLVHLIVQRELRALTGLPDDALLMTATVLVQTVAVIAVSLVITALLRRIPGLRATV
nr:acyltransferase family protein [Nocardiopsis ansamitocini]